MSNPRYIWWSYAKSIVKSYPALRKEYDALHLQNISFDPERIPGGNSLSRRTENIALRQLPPAKQANYDAVTKAIEQTQILPNGDARLQVIDMVFWKQSHTLDGAAYKIGYSYDHCKRFHRDFIRLVGFNRGLEDVE